MMEMKLYFSELADKRDNRGLRHDLGNIIVMSIYAVLCGYTCLLYTSAREPKLEEIIEKIKNFISETFDYDISEEEAAYLAMHILRIRGW